jgi:hypothetical protein
MAEPFDSGAFHAEAHTAAHNAVPTSDDDFFPKIHPEFSEHQTRTARGKHSERPDGSDDSSDSNLTVLQWLEEAGRSCVHNALEDSANGVGQLVDHISGENLIPNVQIVEPAEEATLGSSRWYAQTIGAGIGSIPAFIATDLVTRRLSGAEWFMKARKYADDIPVLSAVMGEEKAHRFLAPLAHSAVNGALYGTLFAPADPQQGDFWQQRGINTLLAATCFTTQYGISHGVMDGIEKAGIGHMHFAPGSKLDVKTFLTHAGSNVLGGVGAGVVGSEVYSGIATHAPASRDLLEDSVARFALTSFGLDALHSLASNVTARVKAGSEGEEGAEGHSGDEVHSGDEGHSGAQGHSGDGQKAGVEDKGRSEGHSGTEEKAGTEEKLAPSVTAEPLIVETPPESVRIEPAVLTPEAVEGKQSGEPGINSPVPSVEEPPAIVQVGNGTVVPGENQTLSTTSVDIAQSAITDDK